jgi:hypothetical protein
VWFSRIFDAAVDLLGVHRLHFNIARFTPLPMFRDAPFDVATAHQVCFNRHNHEDLWGSDEWRFFLDDLSGQVVAGGQIVLRLNREWATNEAFTPQLREFFQNEAGGRVSDLHVHLRAPVPTSSFQESMASDPKNG